MRVPLHPTPIDLQMWLFVDGIARAAMLGLFFITAISSCINYKCGASLFLASMIISTIYSICNLGWLIIGAMLFWGQIFEQISCSPEIIPYMFAVLIFGFCGTCLNICTGISTKTTY